MANYYDWHKTLSYDADVTMVIGARGIGKTFGLRKQCIKDFLRDGSTFVEITRYKSELSTVSNGYFGRLQDLEDFDDYVFKTTAYYGFIAPKPEGWPDTNEKPKWVQFMYFAALTDAQKLKKNTFHNVRRLIFDESVLDSTDRFHTYLPNEFGILANLVDTVSRERADTKGIRPRVYLLGNACDLSNPYFAAYGVETRLRYGYTWYANKTFLLHYVRDEEYAKEKLAGTVAGRMLAGTMDGEIAAYNEFQSMSKDFVMKKTSKSRFSFGIKCNGKTYGVWVDVWEGLYFVTDYIPNNADDKVFALTAADNRINYIAAKKANKTLSYLKEMYYMNLIRYQSTKIMRAFIEEVLKKFGVA